MRMDVGAAWVRLVVEGAGLPPNLSHFRGRTGRACETDRSYSSGITAALFQ